MINLTQEWFLDVIGETYQAVFDLTHLTNVLKKVMHGLASESYVLRLQSQTDRSVGFNLYYGYEPEWKNAYQEYFRRLDPYPEVVDKSPECITICDKYMPKNVLLETEYYNDFLKPQGKLYCIGGHLLRNNQNYVQLGFQRGPQTKPFEEADLRTLNILAPHFRRVLTLNQQFSTMNSQKQVTEMAMGCIPYGIIIFDENLKPTYINRVAEEILEGDFGVKLTSTGIVTPIPSESRQLQLMIRQGLKLAEGHGAMEQNAMQITPRKIEQHPLNAVVIPLLPDSRKMGLMMPSPRVILFLNSLNQAVCNIGYLLKNLFGLTSAESHLAQELASGKNLEDVAMAKGCTQNTVRNQLKAIFSKTGTNRQADLVRLLMTLPRET